MNVKYNYGGVDIDLANYIRNIGDNAKLYMDNLNWTPQLKLEFANSIAKYLEGLKEQLEKNTGRFSTDIAGTIQDRQGILSNADNDDIDPNGSQYYYDEKGNRITTDDYNLLNKRKLKRYKTFNANQQAAAYLDWIGKWTLKKSKESEMKGASRLSKFSLDKNGFERYFYNLEQPAGGDFIMNPLLELDKVNEQGIRDTTERAKYLVKRLSEYVENLEDLDYSESPYKNKDTYKARLLEAIESLINNGYNSQDVASLKRAGLSDNFLKSYFSTGSENIKSELELQAEQAEKNISEREKNTKLQEIIDKDKQQAYELEREKYFDTFLKEHPFKLESPIQAVPLSYNLKGVNDFVRGTANPKNNEEFILAAIKYSNIPLLIKYIKGEQSLIENGKDITALHIANHLDYLSQSDAFKVSDYMDENNKSILGDYYILPGSEDYKNYTYIAYNPTTRLYLELSMLTNELLRKKMAYSHYDKSKKFLLGGNLEYWKNYESQKLNEQIKQDELERKSRETGKSIDKIKAGERKPDELGFNGHDYTRMAAATADVLSIIASYVPVYGLVASTGLGLASTLGNFVNNIVEDGPDMQDLKDLGYGAAMDAAGIIPGLSSIKMAKVAKILKPLSKTLLAGMSLYGLANSAESMNKLFNDSSNMTVDDWKNILTGLLAIGGGTKMHSMHRTVKKLKGPIETVYSVKSKTGNDINLTKDLLEDLKKIKGIEAQNNYLKEHLILGELAEEFRLGWNKIRHFGNPKVKKHSQAKGRDWSKEGEYLPLEYTVVDGKVVPTWKHNDYWASLENIGDLDFKKWFLSRREKNPFFKPTTVEPVQPTLNPSSNNINSLVKALNDLKRADFFRLKAMDADPINYVFRKQGGILDRVKKFLKGGILEGKTNVKSKANWFNHIYNSDEFKNWINTFNKDNYQEFNNLQNSWNTNKRETNYAPGMSITGKYNLNVYDRQKLWNNTGINNVIGRLVELGIISPSGNSGDNKDNGYADGYFGELEWLRHGGSQESWEGHESELKAFQDILAAKGLKYDLNKNTGMYELGILNSIPTSPNNLQQAIETTPTYTSIESSEKDNNEVSSLLKIPNKLKDSLLLKYALPRAIYADSINRKLTNLAIENEKPNFLKPLLFHRYVTSDLDAEMQGAKSAALLRNYASNPITSDADQYLATALQALLEGLQFINLGKAISNKHLENDAALGFEQVKDNRKSEHDTAIVNSEEATKTAANKARAKMAYLAKKHNIWDTLWSQFEYDDKVSQLERKLLEDTFAREDILNNIKYNLEKLAKDSGIVLTPELLNVWNKVASGARTYSTLDSDDERKDWLLVYKISLQLLLKMLKDYYGISDNKWSKIRTFQKPEIEPELILEKGGNINTSKVRERIKNADRFLKSTKKGIDRNERAIERMYKYKSRKK